jgi:CRP-like cAMP-binding protein
MTAPGIKKKNADAIHGILSSISFLGGFNESELNSILSFVEEVNFKAGERIARKGDAPTHIYIIRSGRVELRIGDQSKEVSKREFQIGEHFGEVAILSLVNESATFVAKEDCELIAFPRKAFYQLKTETRISSAASCSIWPGILLARFSIRMI